MKRVCTVIMLITVMIFTQAFACNKAKAVATIRDADELAAKLLIYGRNIAKANNESFRQGNISAEVHLATNKGVDAYLKGVDVFLAGIDAAKKAVAAGANAAGQVDILQALFDREVVQAALALSNLLVAVPPELADKIGGWIAAIQLAVTTFKALFAGVRKDLLEVQNA